MYILRLMVFSLRYRRGSTKRRCGIAAVVSAIAIVIILITVKLLLNPNTSDSIGDNFSGMIGSTLALIGMSVAGSVFLVEFLESNAEKDSRYDTVSDMFREDMEDCMKWIIGITIGQIAVLSVFLMMDVGNCSNMSGSRELITYLSTGLFCWNCCLILQFDYDLVTVKKRMRTRSELEMKLFCIEILQTIKNKLNNEKHDEEEKKINEFLNQIDRKSRFTMITNALSQKSTDSRMKKLEETFNNLDEDGIDFVSFLKEHKDKKLKTEDVKGALDPFKIFHTMESVIECFVDLPEGTVISNMHGFQAMNRMSDFMKGMSKGGEALYHDYILFRELRDYVVVSGVIDSSDKDEGDGAIPERLNKRSFKRLETKITDSDLNLYYYCMMFCSLILQRRVADSMSERKLSKIHFFNNNFDNANMKYATINESVLENTTFIGAKANGVRFLEVNARNLRLDKAICNGMVTTGSIYNLETDPYTELDRWAAHNLNLSFAKLDGPSMEYTSFRVCHLSNIDMDHVSNRFSTYIDVVVVEGNCRNVDFSMSELKTIYCDSTDIYDSSFESCIMYDIRLNDVFIRNSSMLKIDGSKLRIMNSTIEDSSLGGTLSDTRISDSCFTGLSMYNTKFEGCSFDVVSFASGRGQAFLSDIIFRDCSIMDTSFNGVRMENVQFDKVRFKNVCFESCRLDNINFNQCTFMDCVVNRRSSVENVSFSGDTIGTLHIEGDWNEYY